KSTIMHLLLGFLRPDTGGVRVLGTSDLARVNGRVGYLPERLRYHLRFSAREYLRFLGAFDDLRGADLRRRVDSELAAVGLSEAADRTLATFSRGMLQRVGIAQALLHDPELLLIDEPTGGLDVAGQAEMLKLLGELRQRGCSVLLTTHYLDEIEQVCDRVGVLFAGRMVAEASVDTLLTSSGVLRITLADMPLELAKQLAQSWPHVLVDGRTLSVEQNTPQTQAQLLRTLLDAQVQILSLVPQHSALEDFYSRAIGGEDVRPLPAPDEQQDNSSDPRTQTDAQFAPPGHPDTLSAGYRDAVPELGQPQEEQQQTL
ncbi:MAG: ABC transporter ATP-binding protein, partial [Roseiflexaceae bacterium]|nr:ABC transporter ATP-binding protein [Roseiflexaceae bacterium]